MEAKLTRLAHKIAIQLHLVAESCNICIERIVLLDFIHCLCHCVFVCILYWYFGPPCVLWSVSSCVTN
jgi:hypothetical protein